MITEPTEYWPNWIAQNLMMGVPPEQVVAVMQQHGIHDATNQVTELAQHPIMRAGMQLGRQYAKLHSLVNILHQLQVENGVLSDIDCRSDLDEKTFYQQYYGQNLPVILRGAASHWPAIERWTPAYLKAQGGDKTVEIQADREANPCLYQREFQQFCTPMRLADYVDWVLANPNSNDKYLAAKNNVLALPGMGDLLADIDTLPPFMDGAATPDNTFMWFGPANTLTPLHHDWQNALIIQLYGRKHFKLVSSRQTPQVYNLFSRFSEVDPNEPNFDQFPLFAEAQVYEAILEPGDMIFVPVGWWHHVQAMDISISLTMTHFKANNRFFWQVSQDDYQR